MTVPYVFSNGVGNYPDATKFNANYNFLEVLARRNRLINGNFAINQRQLTSVGDDAYCLDRWYVLTESGNVTVAQMTDQESGTPTSIKLTQPDASPKRIGLAQIIESINVRDLQGAAVQLTGKLKCSSSQPIRFAIIGFGSTADTVTSDIVGNWASTNYTTSNFFIASTTVVGVGTITPSAATWTNFSLTGTLGSDTNVIVFAWTEGTLAQNGTFELARMSLKAGVEIVHGASYSTDIASELVACQRYYEKTYSQLVAPGTTSDYGSRYWKRAVNTTEIDGDSYKVTKRASPTVTLYNASGTSGRVNGSSNAATAQYIGDDGFGYVSIAGGGLTANTNYGYHWVAVSEL